MRICCCVVNGTINPDDCIDDVIDERLQLAGKSKNDDDDDDVEAGDIGVKVNDDDDEHVEFVGLGHILGEFGGGNRSLSECCIGSKCLLSLLFMFNGDEDTEASRLKDCWVVSKLVLGSIRLGNDDSLKENKNG